MVLASWRTGATINAGPQRKAVSIPWVCWSEVNLVSKERYTMLNHIFIELAMFQYYCLPQEICFLNALCPLLGLGGYNAWLQLAQCVGEGWLWARGSHRPEPGRERNEEAEHCALGSNACGKKTAWILPGQEPRGTHWHTEVPPGHREALMCHAGGWALAQLCRECGSLPGICSEVAWTTEFWHTVC